MTDFFKELKKYSIITIIVTAVLGVLLIAKPDQMIAYTSLIIGSGIILSGAVSLINYFVKKTSKLTLVMGIIALIAGVIICCAYRQIVSVMIFFMGIILLVGGVTDLVNSIDVARRHYHSWIFTVVLSIASIVLGILSIVNPFDTQSKIVQLIGGGFIVFAVLEFVTYIQVQIIAKKAAETEQILQDGVKATEVDFEEVDD